MSRGEAFAKINLALVVGPLRDDGKHEVATVLERIDLCDQIELEPVANTGISVGGYPDDTLVQTALIALNEAAGRGAGWRVRIEKRIPVAAGLGGGSSDAAAALALANARLPAPLPLARLHALASEIGADVPFFLAAGPQLATGDGTRLEALVLPHDYRVLVAVPRNGRKDSTAAVYRSYDERGGADGFETRRGILLERLSRVRRARDLAGLPRNDLASSPLARELERLGAFRADVSGAGPAVYGLFENDAAAESAATALGGKAAVSFAGPVPSP